MPAEALSVQPTGEAMDSQAEHRLSEPLLAEHPQPAAAPPAEIVLAGFRDCCEETIRYLIQVENLSETDPLVLGLKQHLWERQQALNYQQILQDLFYQTQVLNQESRTDIEENIEVVDGEMDTEVNDSGNASMLDSTATLNSSEITETEHQEDSNISESHVEESLVDSANVSSEDYTEPMLTLALLAQNNPAIASLTEEIISLLDSDDAEDDHVNDNDVIDGETTRVDQ